MIDLHPALYREPPRVELNSPDLRGDLADLRALRAALRQELPIVGICRGHQLLNTASAAPSTRTWPRTASPHSHWTGSHRVSTAHGTLARRVLGHRPAVASEHHQAIARFGRGIRPTAHSPDGVVEAAELTGRLFVLGLQWHPEHPESGPCRAPRGRCAGRRRGAPSGRGHAAAVDHATEGGMSAALLRGRGGDSRRAREEDGENLRSLAELDSAHAPPAPLVIADSDGELLAAVSITDGRAIADPFAPTAELVTLLRLRALQLRADDPRDRRPAVACPPGLPDCSARWETATRAEPPPTA